MYVGQAAGPFWLPCHKHTDYNDPNWKTDHSKPQCAGAAMYRDATGVADMLPDQLHKLTSDPELAFESPTQLLSAHFEVSEAVAAQMLVDFPVQHLLYVEVQRMKYGCSFEEWMQALGTTTWPGKEKT